MDKIVKHLQIHKINQLDENPRYIKVQVEGVMLTTEADSGANINIMSLKQYSDFRKKTASSLDLIRSKIKLKMLTHDLSVIGVPSNHTKPNKQPRYHLFSPPTSEAAGSNHVRGASCWKVGSYLVMSGGLQ